MSFTFGSTGTSGTSGGGFTFGGSSGAAPATSSSSSSAAPSFGGSTTTNAPSSFSFGDSSSSSNVAPAPTSSGFNFGPSTTTATTGAPTTTTTTSSTDNTGGFSFAPTTTTTTNPTTTTTTSDATNTTSSGSLGGLGGGGFSFSSSIPTSLSTAGTSTSFAPTTTSTTSSSQPIALTASGGDGSGTSLLSIKMRYDKNKKFCKFHFFFYNVVQNEQQFKEAYHLMRQKYGDAISDAQWINALERAPYRLMLPIPVRSFEELANRIEIQNTRRAQLEKVLSALKSEAESYKRKRLETLREVEEIRARHRKSSERILRLMKGIEVRMQQGVYIRTEDIAIDERLKSLTSALHQPNQFRGRLNELRPKIDSYTESTNRLLSKSNESVTATLNDPETIQSILNFLNMQSQGIGELSHVLKKDLDDANKMLSFKQ